MHAAHLERVVQGRFQILDVLDTRALCALSLGVFDEIGVSERHPEIGEPIDRLFPADHTVGIVLDQEDDEVQPQRHGGLKLPAVHHEAAIPTDRHDAPRRVKHGSHHR